MLQQMFDIANYTFNFYAIPPFVTAIAILLIGIIVLIHGHFSMSSPEFFIIALTVSIWQLGVSLTSATTNEEIALYWSKIIHISIFFIPTAVYYFTMAILEIKKNQLKFIWICFSISMIFSLINIWTDHFHSEFYHYWWGLYPKYDWLSLLFIPFFYIMIIISLHHYWIAFKKSKQGSTSQHHIKILMIAFIIGILASLDFIATAGIPIYPCGYIPAFIQIMMVAHTICYNRTVVITPAFIADHLINTMTEALLVLDSEKKIRLVNHIATELFGYSENDLIGKPASIVINNQMFLEQLDKLTNSNQPNNNKITCYPRINGTLSLSISSSVIRDGANDPVAIVCIARDTTEGLNFEKNLSTDYQLSCKILEKSPFGIFIVDNKGTINFSNPAIIRLTADLYEQFIGSNIFDLSIYNEIGFTDKFTSALHGNSFFIGPVDLISNDGNKLIILNFIGIPLEQEGEKKVLVFVEDITNLINAEEKQKQLQAQLLHSQKMEAVGLLAGGVAHDFNNILSAILGYGHLIKMDITDDDPINQYINQIIASSDRGSRLTQSLLAFSRKQIINLMPVNLNEIVQRISKLLLRLISEDIKMELNLVNEYLTIIADNGQIEQVLMNLATNARDAMPEGGTLIIETKLFIMDTAYIKTHGYGKTDKYALISVSDTGKGMDKNIRDQIFKPFFTTKKVGKGTGLGLSIIYSIIKQHNGYVNFYSEPAKGTTFKIYIPIVKAHTEIKEVKEAITTSGGTESILLVEDEAEVREITKELLERVGYKVFIAVDGDEAISLFKEKRDKIHFLILDVVLPKKNGKEVYDEIKKIKSNINTLFISGYTESIIRAKGILPEKFNFLSKPVNPTELLRKIREILDNGIKK